MTYKSNPTASKAQLSWENEFSKVDFQNFNEIKKVYKNASCRKPRVIFNIKGNDFRLIVSVNFIQQAYVIWFGPHKEYDTIDVETVRFDKNINNFRKG
ncbi:type II toxin-antitoxin system HigB family toxin [Pelobium manganitolerans]|uniref:type II toxin-antitoxin system HigB family toxin n=1 Tax=Pelobium manganitolerans TaxID=1842495 RepID=UPI0037428BB7